MRRTTAQAQDVPVHKGQILVRINETNRHGPLSGTARRRRAGLTSTTPSTRRGGERGSEGDAEPRSCHNKGTGGTEGTEGTPSALRRASFSILRADLAGSLCARPGRHLHDALTSLAYACWALAEGTDHSHRTSFPSCACALVSLGVPFHVCRRFGACFELGMNKAQRHARMNDQASRARRPKR